TIYTGDPTTFRMDRRFRARIPSRFIDFGPVAAAFVLDTQSRGEVQDGMFSGYGGIFDHDVVMRAASQRDFSLHRQRHHLWLFASNVDDEFERSYVMIGFRAHIWR